MSVDRDGEFESAVRSNVGVTIGDWWKMVIAKTEVGVHLCPVQVHTK